MKHIIESLPKRYRRLALMLRDCVSVVDCANILTVSVETIAAYKCNIKSALGVFSDAELVKKLHPQQWQPMSTCEDTSLVWVCVNTDAGYKYVLAQLTSDGVWVGYKAGKPLNYTPLMWHPLPEKPTAEIVKRITDTSPLKIRT